jgi:hypothetical protein
VSCPTPNTSLGPIGSDCRYALERTNSFIKVWFWGRGSSSTPAEVANGAGSINTDNWVRRMFLQLGRLTNSLSRKKGRPDAYFPDAQCDIGAHFGPASIILNIDLCEWLRMAPCGLSHSNNHLGGWAESSYSSSGCPGTCVGEFPVHSGSERSCLRNVPAQTLSTTILGLSVMHSSSSPGLRFTSETTDICYVRRSGLKESLRSGGVTLISTHFLS